MIISTTVISHISVQRNVKF